MTESKIRYKIKGLTDLVAIGETTKSEIKGLISDEKITDSENLITIDTDNEFVISEEDKYRVYLSDRDWYKGKIFEEYRTEFIFNDNGVLRCIDSNNTNALEEISIDGNKVIFYLKPELCIKDDSESVKEFNELVESSGIKYLDPKDVEYKYICKTDADTKNIFIDSVYDAFRYPYRFSAYIYKKNGDTVIWTPDNNREILIAKSDDNITEWIGRNTIPGSNLPWYRQEIK